MAAETTTVVVTGKPVSSVTKRPDPFDGPKTDWEYVTIPANDIYDHPFSDIRINGRVFKHGEKHYVPKEYADEINRILKAHEQYQLQLLQPRKRKAVLAQVNKNSSGGGLVS